ncbi:HPr family phosphocarrier protein [Acidilobus sp.]|uniref:HPr family phosphocarrier protein n=1 Tax=Acidilobus sp. TaxID=1872109 RepID=UPI003D08192B
MYLKETVVLENKDGLHARPAALLVQEASKYKSEIYISKDGIKANAKSIIEVMSLGAEQGSKIEIEVNGDDAKEAMEHLLDLIRNKKLAEG